MIGKVTLSRTLKNSLQRMLLHNKVSVLGAAGGIGQPLSLLLKMNPLINELSLYDIQNTPGVAADLSHINTDSTIKGYLPNDDGLKKCLEGSNVVIIPAGVPRKPGMTRDDLFNTNASIIRDLATACAEYCPKAQLLIIANPVNSTVPICAEVFKKFNCFDPKKLFGITSLDLVRASKFVSELSSLKADVEVPVVGGHSGQTIVPLFSQVSQFSLDSEKLKKLVNRVQFGGDEVVKAKDGTGSATLSMAYAGARFANSVLKASSGESVTETAFIKNDTFKDKDVEYFSSKVKLGRQGWEEIIPLGQLTSEEQKLLDEALNQLKGNIKKGVDFVIKN